MFTCFSRLYRVARHHGCLVACAFIASPLKLLASRFHQVETPQKKERKKLYIADERADAWFLYRRSRYKNLSTLKVQADLRLEAESSERQSIWILPLSRALLRFLRIAQSILATQSQPFYSRRGLSAVFRGSNQDEVTRC